jgi:uncharacterized repeat protein (TIGR01451 family)
MTRNTVIAALTTAMLLLMVSTSFAADGKGNLVLESINEVDVVVENEKGEKEVKRIAAAKGRVLPGDDIFFSVRFENIGAEPADDIVITNPIPDQVTIKPLTVFGENTSVTFSINGAKSFHKQGELFVTEENGKKRPAKSEEYTHVRWTFSGEVAPGEKGSVGFTAIVD